MYAPVGLVKEMIALAVGTKSINCLGLPERKPMVLRPTGGVREEAEGEILQVVVRWEWQFGRTQFISGKVIGGYIDGRVLSPVPLGLTVMGAWDPHHEGQDSIREIKDGGGEISEYMRIILDEGCRTVYGLEQIIPGYDYRDFQDDPIANAAEYGRAGYYDEAFELLHSCLKGDLRCIDAYAYLGLYRMRSGKYAEDVEIAIKCYQAGVAVGGQAFPAGFDGLLPWGWIDNRPFLRAFHGLGICQWRLGLLAEAEETFHRLWRFDPDNPLGGYDMMLAVREGRDYLDWREDW